MPSIRKPAQASSTNAEPQTHITVLAITNSSADHSLLQGIFHHTRWRLVGAHTLQEAAAAMPQCQVVLSEADLPDGNWKDVLSQAASLPSGNDQPARPQVIVMSPQANVQLLNEVLSYGGFNLIGRPFKPREITQLISLAWQCRKNQAHSATGDGFTANLHTLATKIGPSSETALVKRANSG